MARVSSYKYCAVFSLPNVKSGRDASDYRYIGWILSYLNDTLGLSFEYDMAKN